MVQLLSQNQVKTYEYSFLQSLVIRHFSLNSLLIIFWLLKRVFFNMKDVCMDVPQSDMGFFSFQNHLYRCSFFKSPLGKLVAFQVNPSIETKTNLVHKSPQKISTSDSLI